MPDRRAVELFGLKIVVAVDPQVLERLCRKQIFHIRIDTNRYSDTAYRDNSFGRPSNRPSYQREARPTNNYNRSGGSNFPKPTSRYMGGGVDYDGNTGYPKGYRR